MGRRSRNPRTDKAKRPAAESTQPGAPVPRRRIGIRVVVGIVVLALAALAVQQTMLKRCVAKADQAIANRQWDAADQWLDKATVWAYAKGPLTLKRARVARLRGNGEEFERLLEQASSQGLASKWARRERLLHKIQTKGARAHVHLLEGFLAEGQDSSAVLESFAEGFFAEGDSVMAQQVLERWLVVEPDAVIAQVRLARLYFDLGRFAEAESMYQRALARNPNLSDARLGLARVSYSIDKTNQAITNFAHVLRDDPSNVEARLSRASLLMKQGQAEDAVKDFAQVIRIDPDGYPARFKLATYYAEQQQPQRVVELLDPIMDRFIDDIALNYLVANAQTQLGQGVQAEAFLQRYFEGRKQLDTLTTLQEQVDPGATDATLAKRIGLAYLRFQWDEADQWLSQAIDLGPTDPDLYRAMAELYEKNGSSERAAEQAMVAELLEARADAAAR